VTLQLHGIVRADHDDLGFQVVVSADLAVVVSELPDGQQLTSADAMPHFELLCALVAHGPVVPLVFGTVAADEDAVRSDVLPPVTSQVREQLDRLEDVVELHVYLRFQGDTVLTADRMLEPVAALAGDSAVLPGEPTEARRAFLVPRSRTADVARAAAALAADDVAVDLVGPLPVYSFLTAAPVSSRWGW
jgi:hypothetical protein